MKKADLPEPEYKGEMGGFSLCFYKEENLRKMELNERQIRAVMYVKEKGKITNKEYQELFQIGKRQTTYDLKVLQDREILERTGTGKDTPCVLKRRQRSKGAKRKHEITAPKRLEK